MKNHGPTKYDDGYIALMSVLILTAVGVLIATTFLYLSATSSATITVLEKGIKARAYSNICAESGLQKIRDINNSSGLTTLTLAEGTCTYNITVGAGENRTIDATGTVDGMIRKTRIIISAINPQIITTSWQEVADF